MSQKPKTDVKAVSENQTPSSKEELIKEIKALLPTREGYYQNDEMQIRVPDNYARGCLVKFGNDEEESKDDGANKDKNEKTSFFIFHDRIHGCDDDMYFDPNDQGLTVEELKGLREKMKSITVPMQRQSVRDSVTQISDDERLARSLQEGNQTKKTMRKNLHR